MSFDFRRRLAFLLLLAAGLVIALAVVWQRQDAQTERPTLARLVAKNYRPLSHKQARTLLRFAQSEYLCLKSRGAKVSRPVASPTRILIRAPKQSARALARLQLACDPGVGPPPAKATLQARQGQVLVYLPKWCLIDPTDLPTT